ncbi:hypothetical protein LshimejAT787_0900710 [Lyophyllum shimeji]|uniref:BTB domain-containing protein n=1 Tax=Lyophyllum shimeji TaxID=47721 RepID=A0A9P3US57_LYOSH|nr:hypothetical protein LshimejAT787_0900710 [Lyophyllum shimeji]
MPEPSSTKSSTPVESKAFPHDEEYYMENIVFLVEGYLFSVPRYYFAHASDIFWSTFSLPPGDGKTQEGSSDSCPFVLEGVSRADFKGLLRVMYPLQMPHLGNDMNLPRKDWIAALKLATMWNFRNIRQLAISKLSLDTGIDPVDKVVLAKEYKVPDWLLAGYHELVKRSTPITPLEAARLGLETTVYLFHVREDVCSSEFAYYSGYKRREDQNFMEQVKKAFKKELKEVEAAHVEYNALPSSYPPVDMTQGK